MSTLNGSGISWPWRAVLLLVAIAMIPACGSGGGGGIVGAGPSSGIGPIGGGIVQLQAGYTLSVFATGPAGSTKPDSILQVGSSVYISYQDALNSDGTNPGGVPPGQGSTQVCQYDQSGNLLRTITVSGHNDGMMQFDSNTLWVMSNEDSNPYLNVINLTTGAVTQVYPTGGVPPNPPAPTLHGGGYDDMIMIDGVVYVSCSNPTNPGTHVPLVVKLTINGGGTFDVTPVIYSNVGAAATDSVTDVTSGSAITNLGFTDPDSMALAPNGDLMVDGQADSTLAFIHSPLVANVASVPQEIHQFVNVVPITLGGNAWPVDDTRFAPSGTSFMLVTDTGANTIYRVDPPATGFQTGSVASTPGGAPKGTAYSAGSGGIYTLDLPTGVLTAVFTGMKGPHGMRFITPPASVPATVTVMDPNYKVSLFAQAPAGSSKPDSIVQVGGPGGNVFIGYQGQLNHDGTIPPNAFGTGPEGFVSVVQYDLTGKVLKTYSVKGHIDGMVEIAPPAADGSNLWVMSNEDASPVLTTIVTATGVQTEYQPAAAPAHGGGYDDLSLIGGKVYVSCSNPAAKGVGPIVGQITLNTGPKTFSVATVTPGTNAAAYDVLGGAMVSGGFALIDPDSTEITPTGDLLVDGQQDAILSTLTAAQLVAGLPPSTAATLTAAAGGASTAGTHSGFVTFVNASGETFAGPSSAQITTTLANATVNWTAIPTGPAGTTARNLYMTIAGDTGLPLFVHKISDNTTTTFSASVADASLGAAAPVVKNLSVTLFGNPLPADDTRFVPAVAPQFLLLTDSSANQTYRIDSAAAWTAGNAFDAGAISLNSLNMATGIATPVVTGMKAPHGLLFVK